MQNVLVPGAVVLLAVVVWLRRKPLKPMLASTDASSVAQLNRAQLELVVDAPRPVSAPEDPLAHWSAPKSQQDRIVLQERLRDRMSGGPDDRLMAVREAA
ncbi:MAG: HEAT repeat domain-containing protein, partial [Cyanobacteria bacterium]|nr:HEAT repeat domain-containing protein [Cyanobacteriota bacterium]